MDRRACSRRSSSDRLLKCVWSRALATRACAGVAARMSTCTLSLREGTDGRKQRRDKGGSTWVQEHVCPRTACVHDIVGPSSPLLLPGYQFDSPVYFVFVGVLTGNVCLSFGGEKGI